MKLLLDTNIWISALLYGGKPRKILTLAEDHNLTLITSTSILQEIDRTLRKDKLQNRLNSLAKSADDLMAMVIENSQIYETITLPDIPNLRDQNDKIILAAALTAQANIIITGDNDLLILKDFQDIPIMTAKTFLDQYFPEI